MPCCAKYESIGPVYTSRPCRGRLPASRCSKSVEVPPCDCYRASPQNPGCARLGSALMRARTVNVEADGDIWVAQQHVLEDAGVSTNRQCLPLVAEIYFASRSPSTRMEVALAPVQMNVRVPVRSRVMARTTVVRRCAARQPHQYRRVELCRILVPLLFRICAAAAGSGCWLL